MEKKEFTTKEIERIIQLYTEDKFGMRKIGELYGVSKTVIRRTLIENNIELDTPGQRYRGGKSETDKRYYRKNKKRRATYFSQWQQKNKEHLREYHTKWREENKEHVRKYKRDAERKRYQSDPTYRLSKNMRYGIWASLKDKHLDKVKRTFDILPYTVEELKQHLETLFKDNMTWDNYGEWHVDHRRPISDFDYTSETDPAFLECWSLDNLQPLWGEENWSKGKRVI